MRIQRNRLNFRKRRRRSGYISLAVLLGVMVSLVTLSWNWIGQRLNIAASRGSAATLQAAQQAFLRGDLNSAIDLARQVLDQTPDDVDARVLLARALIYRSYTDYNRAVDRQSALQLTSEALETAPDNPTLLAIHAFALQAAGSPAEGARVAQQVLNRDPQNIVARVALGLAYGGVGSFDNALSENLQAAHMALQKSDPWQMDTQRALAITYSDLGDYAKAIQAAESALAQNNHLIPLYFERALYALQIGDADAATVAYFQVLAYDPGNVKARLRLCELSSTMRERESAIRYCSEVAQRAPEWADGWYQLGHEYFLQGNFVEAQKDLHRCSSLQVMQNVPVKERRFECWYLQGQAAEILGDCADLVATYNEFRAMTADADVQETWVYPPEGPPGCVTATSLP